jgi:type VI protein secretion system component Hcp
MAKATQFLRFEGDDGGLAVEGECFDEKHRNEIDITGWNWAVADPKATPKSNAGEGAAKTKGEAPSDGKPKPKLLHFSKFTDRATTPLLQAMHGGNVFSRVLLTIEERFLDQDQDSEADAQRFYMEVELNDAVVVHFSLNVQAEGAGVSMTEEWDLSYSGIKFSYRRRGHNGWIDQPFPWKPEEFQGVNQKSPLTAAEKQDKDDATFAEFLKRHPQQGATPKRGK